MRFHDFICLLSLEVTIFICLLRDMFYRKWTYRIHCFTLSSPITSSFCRYELRYGSWNILLSLLSLKLQIILIRISFTFIVSCLVVWSFVKAQRSSHSYVWSYYCWNLSTVLSAFFATLSFPLILKFYFVEKLKITLFFSHISITRIYLFCFFIWKRKRNRFLFLATLRISVSVLFVLLLLINYCVIVDWSWVKYFTFSFSLFENPESRFFNEVFNHVCRYFRHCELSWLLRAFVGIFFCV